MIFQIKRFPKKFFLWATDTLSALIFSPKVEKDNRSYRCRNNQGKKTPAGTRAGVFLVDVQPETATGTRAAVSGACQKQ